MHLKKNISKILIYMGVVLKKTGIYLFNISGFNRQKGIAKYIETYIKKIGLFFFKLGVIFIKYGKILKE